MFFSQVPPVPSRQKEEARILVWYCLPCQTLYLGPEPLCSGSNRGPSGLCSHTPPGSKPAILRQGAVMWPQSPDLRALVKLVIEPLSKLQTD